MKPKLAIAHRTKSFSEHWIAYCKEHAISFRIVDPTQSNIIGQIRDCDGFLWHWHHTSTSNLFFAKPIIHSLEAMGIRVFPNSNTSWHFDDKIGQKYLLEATGAPLVPTHVFYNKKDANNWISETTFPKVFKLKGGASAINVQLVQNKKQAKRLIRKAFGSGFRAFNRLGIFKERLIKTLCHPTPKNSISLAKSVARMSMRHDYEKANGKEQGYIYFQDFCPNNQYDTRITIIGNRAFGFRRFVRENDFRASGSGKIDYNVAKIDSRCIQIAFNLTQKLNIQSCAFDFMYDSDNNPVIGEISYCYMHEAVAKCDGYWDPQLRWHQEKSMPAYLMLENLLREIDAMPKRKIA